MYLICIQTKYTADICFCSDSLGVCIKELAEFIKLHPFTYKGHFIIKKDGTSF
jgi:hypothetical protein